MAQVSPIARLFCLLAVMLSTIGLTTGCRETIVRGELTSPVATSPEPRQTLPNPSLTYQGAPVGFTEDGNPFWGNPAAPVTLEEYSDYLCPFCVRHFSQTLPALAEKYITTGQVQYVFRDMPLASLHPNAPKAHAAAQCVAEQGALFFWKMHNELFRTRDQWDRLPDPTDYLADVAYKVGADIAAYKACIASGRKEAQVQSNIAAGQSLSLEGTPSFRFIQNRTGEAYTLVGAQPLEIFAQWIDVLVVGKAPPQKLTAEAKPKELPFWANPQGLAPDPQRPGLTMAGDPYKGNPQAKIAVVEFSNFQCPPCRQHVIEVQPTIDTALVESGQILWVFKNLPLKSMPQSTIAAAAAECAGEQRRFWEMHHLLFEAQEQWAVEDPKPVLLQLAGQLGLNMEQFEVCLGNQQTLDRVMSDLFDAQGIASTTPTFIVLDGQKGIVYRGSRSGEEFVSLLRGFLERIGTGEKASSTSGGI